MNLLDKDRDRHRFSEIGFSMGFSYRNCFKNKIYDRKNHVVKKNRVENGFFYEKIAYKKCVIFPQLYIVKIGKMRALTFYELKNCF